MSTARAERVELLEQHREHLGGRERTGHVAHRHGHAGATPDQFVEGRAGERLAQGAPQRPGLIGEAAQPTGLDHVGPRGQIHGQPGPAVGQLDGCHGGTSVVRRRVRCSDGVA
jgi:hypothetical protein